MAYSINGLLGHSKYEFPHSKYFEGDGNLAEILRMYELLVHDYNTLVTEIVEAHRLYAEAQDFVERQERIFLDNQTKIMAHFKKVLDEVNRLQQELVNFFDNSVSEMVAKQAELERLFRELNSTTLDKMQEYLNTAITDFRNERMHFEETFVQKMEEFKQAFDKEIDEAIDAINNNYNAFKLWIGTEFDILIDLLVSNGDTLNEYFRRVQDFNAKLMSEYEEKLRITRDAVIREVNRGFDEHENDVEEQFVAFKKYVDGLVIDINDKIEEAKNINEHVLVKHIHVFSPPTRKIRTLQRALNEMYIYFRAWSIRAEEYDALQITAGEYDNWVCDKGLYPKGAGIKALDYDALAKWILLEKPDILEQLKDKIEDITYEKLAENQKKIEEAIQKNLETAWGERVINLENAANVLENLINENKEYTAQIEQKLVNEVDRLEVTSSIMNDKIVTLENNVNDIVGSILLLQDLVIEALK